MPLLRHATDAGYEAVGVDCSPHQLEYAANNAPDADLLCADVRVFAIDRRFDVITCLHDSLNCLTDPADVAVAIERAAEHLSEDGVFSFDVNTREGPEDRWNSTHAIRGDGACQGADDRLRASGRSVAALR